jgi:terminase large subunit-like protein
MDDWYPHKGAQEEFCANGSFECLYGGAAGPGKTDCLISLALRHIDKGKYRGLILRRTFPRLEEIIDRCHERYPSYGGVYRSTERKWYFPSGATIKLGHMQHEDDKRDYQGKEYQFIGWDELTEFTETQYLFVTNSRVRTSDKDIPIRIRATTNPGGIGHRWVKEHFRIGQVPSSTVFRDDMTGQSRCFIPGRVTDNPSLMESDPLYIKRLEGLPEIERRRLLEGDWESFEGQMLSELSQRVHGCEPFEIPPEWEKFCVLDWGYARPFSVGWYAVDYDGILYRYREWYGCKDGEKNVGLRMIAVDVAKGILERETEKVGTRIADPSIWHARPQFRAKEALGQTIHEDFNGQGLFFLKADNDRVQGLQQVHKRLQVDVDVDTESGEVLGESPKFYAFNDQSHFWRTMTELIEDPKNPEDIDTNQEDHIYDDFRYACMARPIQPKRINEVPQGSFAAERNRLIKARKYARRHGVDLGTAYSRVR